MAQYEEGLQHIYPFYYPGDEDPSTTSSPAAGLPGSQPPSGQYACPDNPDEHLQVRVTTVKIDGKEWRVQVHRDIAERVEDLFEMANSPNRDREGEDMLSAGGFRSCQRQLELRTENCGFTTEYEIWERSAGDCKPHPIAKPGKSNHQAGKAIDVYYLNSAGVYAGRLGRRNSWAFRWLCQNAIGRGLNNLNSEPWHWDTGSIERNGHC